MIATRRPGRAGSLPMVRGPPPPWQLHEGEATKLDETVIDAVCALLLGVIGHGTYSAANAPLVNKIFGRSKGLPPHCHQRGKHLEQAALEQFRCAAAMSGSRCIVAAVYRHVPPPRRGSPQTARSDLLLLAVEEKYRRVGFGSLMVNFVKRLALDNATSCSLLALPAAKAVDIWCAIWHDRAPHLPTCCVSFDALSPLSLARHRSRPSFGFEHLKPLDTPKDVFKPWSDRVQLMHCPLDGSLVDNEDAIREAMDSLAFARGLKSQPTGLVMRPPDGEAGEPANDAWDADDAYDVVDGASGADSDEEVVPVDDDEDNDNSAVLRPPSTPPLPPPPPLPDASPSVNVRIALRGTSLHGRGRHAAVPVDFTTAAGASGSPHPAAPADGCARAPVAVDASNKPLHKLALETKAAAKADARFEATALQPFGKGSGAAAAASNQAGRKRARPAAPSAPLAASGSAGGSGANGGGQRKRRRGAAAAIAAAVDAAPEDAVAGAATLDWIQCDECDEWREFDPPLPADCIDAEAPWTCVMAMESYARDKSAWTCPSLEVPRMQCGECEEWRDFTPPLHACAIDNNAPWRCVDAPRKHSPGWATWRCPSLRTPIAWAQCDECNSWRNFTPPLPVGSIDEGAPWRCCDAPDAHAPRKGTWRCPTLPRDAGMASTSSANACGMCTHRDACTRGAMIRPPWLTDQSSLCGTCTAIVQNGEYCAVCNRAWKCADGRDAAKFNRAYRMIGCGSCGKWVHFTCEGLDAEIQDNADWKGTEYLCPTCR